MTAVSEQPEKRREQSIDMPMQSKDTTNASTVVEEEE
jgi:hypothetical protein